MEVTVVVFMEDRQLDYPEAFTDRLTAIKRLKAVGYKLSEDDPIRYTYGNDTADLYTVQVKGA